MVIDTKEAYFFYADAARNAFVELPWEDASDVVVGLLVKSFYGTRDAALNCSASYTNPLCKLGF